MNSTFQKVKTISNVLGAISGVVLLLVFGTLFGVAMGQIPVYDHSLLSETVRVIFKSVPAMVTMIILLIASITISFIKQKEE